MSCNSSGITEILRTSTPRSRSSCARNSEFSSLVFPDRISFPITIIPAVFAIGQKTIARLITWPQPRPRGPLIYSASESDANMLWATRFFAPDPFIFIEKRGKRYLVMNDLEIDRARTRPASTRCCRTPSYPKQASEPRNSHSHRVSEVLVEVFSDLGDSRRSKYRRTFPVGLADALRRKAESS